MGAIRKRDLLNTALWAIQNREIAQGLTLTKDLGFHYGQNRLCSPIPFQTESMVVGKNHFTSHRDVNKTIASREEIYSKGWLTESMFLWSHVTFGSSVSKIRVFLFSNFMNQKIHHFISLVWLVLSVTSNWKIKWYNMSNGSELAWVLPSHFHGLSSWMRVCVFSFSFDVL